MKKFIYIILCFGIFIISSNSYAVSNKISCIFYISSYQTHLGENLDIGIFKHLNFNVKFETNAKLDWRISDIGFPKNFKTKFHNSIDNEITIFKKIVNGKKLNKDEEYLLSNLATGWKVSVNEVYKKINKLSNKEKKELINAYQESINEYMPMVDEFFLNNESILNEIKDTLNTYNEITSEQNNVHITAVLDSGIMFKNTINYSTILNNNSKNAMKLTMKMLDNTAVNFESNCSNKNNPILDDDSNTIESKLQKLKSLFDKNLITQDEYDKKRKEILDAM